MEDYNRLVAYWSDCPPVHILVGSYLGVIKEKPTLTWETESVDDLFARWGSAQNGE